MIREFAPLPTPCENLCGADIYTGRGLVAALPALLDERTGGGRLLLVYDEEGQEESERVKEALRGFGTRVTVKSAEDAPLAEECCMLALGVGGEPAFAAARSAARVRGAECALLPVTPSEDGVLDGGADIVFLDDEVLERAPADAFAAAVGMLAALPVKRFEEVCAEKLYAEKKDAFGIFSAEEGESASSLARKVAASGARGRRYAVDVTANMLALIAAEKGKPARRRGEYVFVAACALAAFYKSYLSSPAIDTLPPVDHDSAAEEIARLTGEDRGKVMQAFDIFDVSGYFRINYILGEYRMDLLAELSSVDLGGAERKWRRMYPDAGFWMKSAFTSRDILRAMSLAGEFSGGLLGFAAATGLFAAMRAEARGGEKKKNA